MTEARYAIYFAPPAASALWRFGSSVIGYDAATGEDVPVPDTLTADGAERWARQTTDPRRYGFHGTLKAPFRLADRRSADDLIASVEAFARSQDPIVLEGLKVTLLGRFVALTETAPSAELDAFAGRVVGAFEHLRAPLDDAERERRLKAPLTARQRVHLERYGYPHVFEDFRFHMTLTGPLDEEARAPAFDRLERLHARMVPPGPVPIDAIAVYEQPEPEVRFRIVARFSLG